MFFGLPSCGFCILFVRIYALFYFHLRQDLTFLKEAFFFLIISLTLFSSALLKSLFFLTAGVLWPCISSVALLNSFRASYKNWILLAPPCCCFDRIFHFYVVPALEVVHKCAQLFWTLLLEGCWLLGVIIHERTWCSSGFSTVFCMLGKNLHHLMGASKPAAAWNCLWESLEHLLSIIFLLLLLPSVHGIIKVYHYYWTTSGCCLGHFPNFLPQRWDGCDGVFQNKFLSSTRHAETMHSSPPPYSFWWLKFKLLDCGFCRGMALHSPASPLAPNSI